MRALGSIFLYFTFPVAWAYGIQDEFICAEREAAIREIKQLQSKFRLVAFATTNAKSPQQQLVLMKKDQQIRANLDKQLRALRRIGEDSWPEYYRNYYVKFIKEFDSEANSSLSDGEYSKYRYFRFQLAMQPSSWSSRASLSSPWLIHELRLRTKQKTLIDSTFGRFDSKFQRLVEKEKQIRMEYLKDCLSELSTKQKKVLKTELGLKDLESLLEKYPTIPIEPKAGEDELPESKWLFVPRVVKTPSLYPNVPRLNVTESEKAKLVVIWKESVKSFLTGKKLSDDQIRSLAKRVEKVVPVEQAKLVWKGMFKYLIVSTRFPGFRFTAPVTIEILGLDDQVVSRLKAYQHAAGKEIGELRKQFVDTQNEAIKAAFKHLDMEQKAWISNCTQDNFDWQEMLTPKWAY